MSLRTPVLTYVYNRYKAASTTQDAVVELRVSFNKHQKYMSTGIRLFPKEWQQGRVTNRTDALILNKTLDKLMIDVKTIVYEMIEDGNIDIYAIPARLEVKRSANDTLYTFCEKRAEFRKYGKAEDSQERYDRFLRFLKEYGKIRTFDDLREDKVMELDKYLKKQNDMKAKSRWNNYHRFLNSFIIDAQKEHLVQRNPYDSVKIDRGNDHDGIEKYLSPAEFAKLKQAVMSCKRLEKVQDLFIFQSYTCLSYKDLKHFDSKKIIPRGDKRYYTGFRGKTKIDFTIPILPGAQAVLDKYNGKLPIISNVKYNKYVKEVVAEAGIDKHVTTHWARHTGATMLLNAGVSMQTVSKVCGHSSIKMTEKIYAKLLPETVVSAVYDVEDKL